MTIKKRFHFTTQLFVLISLPAFATVNVREGAYLHSAVDFDGREHHDAFRLERLYNSRSSFSGLFGFGWCTSFDSGLRKISDGRLSLFTCGAADEIRFLPVAGPGERVREWRAENAPAERLLFADDPPHGRWMRPTARGDVESYDAETGRLVGITDRAGRILRLLYDPNGRLKRIETPSSSLQFAHDPESGRITAIETAGDPRRALYQYQGADLVRATRPHQEVWAYRYDSLHNLTALSLNGRMEETVSYETALDRVRQVARWNESKCEQNFTYQTAPDVVQEHLIAKASTRCRDRLVGEKRFDFWYDRAAETPGARSLNKIKITTSGGGRPAAHQPPARDLR